MGNPASAQYPIDKINYLNDTVPHFEFRTIAGKVFNSEDLRGKVVLLDFWNEHCAPCIKQMPDLQALAKTYDPKKVVILSLCRDSTQLFNNIMKRRGITTLNVVANSEWFHRLLGVWVYPDVAIIDKNGIIKSNITGEEDIQAIKKRIDETL